MKKTIIIAFSGLAASCLSSQAAVFIAGVVDGTLSGGRPKAIVLQASTAIADLSTYGVGSANNGGGTDGEEFELSGSATVGQYIVIAHDATSAAFFTNNFMGSNFLLFTSGSAGVNGDDAIELFNNDLVIDTYGDIDTDGNGETWEYMDGYAVRTGGAAGVFNQSNYSSNVNVFDGQNESSQAATLGAAFNNFNAVPEPSSASLLGLSSLALILRRRK